MIKSIIHIVRQFLRDRFNLDEDKADEAAIVEDIRRNVHFKGTNLWTLIFAIMIASIGLNVNSTAVIIGAMLISPLMGPIMGIGLGVGIYDFDLVKKGIKNISIAAFMSIITSAFYFSITPLHDANSELLARTNPSLWDVFIAFFGGLAGIVAGTRNQKSNVIPGVAIATALMPPLCTAGFGLATGQWYFLLGALYLFFINSLFICVATFLIVKRLGFHKAHFQTQSIERRVGRYIWTLVFLTILPSIFLAYRIVERSILEGNAKNFLQEEFRFPKTQIITRNYHIDGGKKTIDLLVVGQEISVDEINALESRMPDYNLEGVKLVIHQGLNAKQEIDIAQIKASVLEDFFREQRKDTATVKAEKIDLVIPDLQNELQSLFPDIESYSLSQAVFYKMDSTRRKDTISLFAVRFKNEPESADTIRLQQWIKQRIKTDSLRLFMER